MNNKAIAEYKSKIKSFNDDLFNGFINKTRTTTLVFKRSKFIDEILISIWKKFFTDTNNLCLVAVGGYGRGELHPYSDIDLLILHREKISAEDERTVANYCRFLWDIGLDLGHSIRTIDDCFNLAKQDVSVMTNLLESRKLCGDNALYQEFFQLFEVTNLWPINDFIDAKMAEQHERHLKFDDTEESLEPNIKDSPGGLRDIQTIFWIIKRYKNTLIAENKHSKTSLISHEELTTLKRCRHFMWKVRFGLHYLRKKKEERLLFEHQNNLAKLFNYGENKTGIEKLMKKYYRVSKEVRLLNEILIQHISELADKEQLKRKKLTEHFDNINNHIEVKRENLFTLRPHSILELFYLMQLNPTIEGIGAKTLRLLRNSLPLIDKEFRKDPLGKEIFLNIMSHTSGQTHAIRRMNTFGVLGAYIPDFGRIVGQMQYDLFHIYTVDAHTLIVVRNLRRFCLEEHKEAHLEQFEIMQNVDNRRILFIAGLLHDIGKGREGDHSIVGEKIAGAFCRRIGLTDYETLTITWLVRYHLLMSTTAQSEDISNPKVVQKFAEKVGDIKRLNYLYLLTAADIMGTSPKIWTPWKGSLLINLYHTAKTALNHESIEPENITERVLEVKNTIFRQHNIASKRQKKYKKFWHLIDDQYFLKFSPSTLNWHAHHACDVEATSLPVAVSGYREDIESNQLFIFSVERESLLATVTLVIDHLDFTILSAHVMRLKNGLTALHFIINPIAGNKVKDENSFEYINQTVKDFIDRPASQLPKAKKRRTERRLQHFSLNEKITFSPSDNGQFTIMSVYTQDKPALLYFVCDALNKSKVVLHSARINTLGERVEDHFFITNRDHEPIDDEATLKEIEQNVIDSIHQQ